MEDRIFLSSSTHARMIVEKPAESKREVGKVTWQERFLVRHFFNLALVWCFLAYSLCWCIFAWVSWLVFRNGRAPYLQQMCISLLYSRESIRNNYSVFLGKAWNLCCSVCTEKPHHLCTPSLNWLGGIGTMYHIGLAGQTEYQFLAQAVCILHWSHQFFQCALGKELGEHLAVCVCETHGWVLFLLCALLVLWRRKSRHGKHNGSGTF